VTADKRYIHVTAMGDAVFARLAEAIGRAELARDDRYRTQVARSANEEALDGIIAAWIAARPLKEVVQALNAGGVPSAPIYTVADIFEDEHFRARDMLLEVPDPKLGSVTLPGIVPRLSGTPGRVRHAGGEVGDDTAAVLREVLGLGEEDIERLKADRIIHARATAGEPQEAN
jgi:crotonobetainyl-CoA:carnitine CoA-transferase CaiB-like acyl-CoA transferase